MRKENKTLYESPHVEVLSIGMDNTLLTGSTGESFSDPTSLDSLIPGDWVWTTL